MSESFVCLRRRDGSLRWVTWRGFQSVSLVGRVWAQWGCRRLQVLAIDCRCVMIIETQRVPQRVVIVWLGGIGMKSLRPRVAGV